MRVTQGVQIHNTATPYTTPPYETQRIPHAVQSANRKTVAHSGTRLPPVRPTRVFSSPYAPRCATPCHPERKSRDLAMHAVPTPPATPPHRPRFSLRHAHRHLSSRNAHVNKNAAGLTGRDRSRPPLNPSAHRSCIFAPLRDSGRRRRSPRFAPHRTAPTPPHKPVPRDP